MKKILSLCFLVWITATMTAQEKIVLGLHWYPQSQFAGYYMALEKGFFKEAGLDVTLLHTSQGNSSLGFLKIGQADAIITFLSQMVVAADEGLAVKSLLQTSQHSSLILACSPAITSLEDLNGKRVTAWKGSLCDVVTCMFNDRRVQVEWVIINGGGVNYLSSGATDAVVATVYNELFWLTYSGLNLKPENQFPLCEYEEYDIPEDGLFCLSSAYNKRPETFKRLREACIKGWDYVRDHPEESLEVVYRYMRQDNIQLSKAHQKWMLENILALQINNKTQKVNYSLAPEDFQSLNNMLLKHGFIMNTLDYNDFIAK